MTTFTNEKERHLPSVEDHDDQEFSIKINVPSEASDEEVEAITALSSTSAATMAIAKIQERVCPVPSDLTAMAALLEIQSRSNGTGEDMLQTQAKTLDLLFSQLVNRAMDQDSMHESEQLLRLAFKAQAQSRATLTAVSDIRHPRITNNIAQVNNSTGNQQINNELHAHGKNSSDEKKQNENPPIKLSEGLENDLLQNQRASSGSTRENQEN